MFENQNNDQLYTYCCSILYWHWVSSFPPGIYLRYKKFYKFLKIEKYNVLILRLASF